MITRGESPQDYVGGTGISNQCSSMVIRQEASAHERDQTLTPHALKARIVGTPGENIIKDRFWKKKRIIPLHKCAFDVV